MASWSDDKVQSDRFQAQETAVSVRRRFLDCASIWPSNGTANPVGRIIFTTQPQVQSVEFLFLGTSARVFVEATSRPDVELQLGSSP